MGIETSYLFVSYHVGGSSIKQLVKGLSGEKGNDLYLIVRFGGFEKIAELINITKLMWNTLTLLGERH